MRWIALALALLALDAAVAGWVVLRDRVGDMSPASPRAVALAQGQRLGDLELPPDGKICPECPVRVIGPAPGGRWVAAQRGRDGRERCFSYTVTPRVLDDEHDVGETVRRVNPCPAQARVGTATGG